VRVSKSGDKGYNQISFYAYSWGSTDITSFEVNPDARIDIVMDKKVYAPGDRAKILFQCPFDGKLLATVERNEVVSYRYLDVARTPRQWRSTFLKNFCQTCTSVVSSFAKSRDRIFLS
jgi:hypothetical protein